MPERSCTGCTKQKEWGCTATSVAVPAGTKGAKPNRDGKTWRMWTDPARMPINFDGEMTWACPRQDLKANPYGWHVLFKYYGMYKAGFMPQGGSVVDQANKAIELFRIVDGVNSEADESLRENPQDKPQKGRPGR